MMDALGRAQGNQHLAEQYWPQLTKWADYLLSDVDWELWIATLTNETSQFTALMNPITKRLRETPTRVPLGDWYDTKNGVALHFQARSVVGGVFIKALADKELTEKWRRFEP